MKPSNRVEHIEKTGVHPNPWLYLDDYYRQHPTEKPRKKRRTPADRAQAKPDRRTMMAPVSDQWYPNFPGNFVCVHVSRRKRQDLPGHVGVWGADDFGMEWFGPWMQALFLFNRLRRHGVLSVAYLKANGFVPA